MGDALHGRTALVTGASSGIGLAIAQRLVYEGARVHAAARRADLIEEAMGRGAIESGRCVAHRLDVGDREAVLELTSQLGADDAVDVVVCAAGTNVRNRRASQLGPDSWDELIRVNLHGTYNVVHGTLDQLRKSAGDLVMISSVAAVWPDHSGSGYGATKAAMLAFARGVSRDEHQNGVRVCSILPGIVDTPILDRRPVPPPEEVRRWCIQPDDVAATVVAAIALPNRANLAEITIVATRLQSLGDTQQANPEPPPS
jgi:NADP-dependent 3-hydroxy acid dehydrogenase YdfG